MNSITTFNSQLINNIFNILVVHNIVDKKFKELFSDTFLGKTKSSFLAHKSLSIIKMSFTDNNRLKIAIDPLVDVIEYPELSENINNTLKQIQSYLENNFTVTNVEDINFITYDISKDLKKSYDEFKQLNLTGIISKNLNNLYTFIEKLSNRVNTLDKTLQKFLNDKTDNTMNYKHLNQSVVEEVAIALVKENGSTTNLDIKNKLRSKGYWATQQLISDTMQEVLDDVTDLYSNNNGEFNTYYIDSMDDDDNNVKLSSSATGSAFLPPTSGLSSTTPKIQQTSNKRMPKGSFTPPKPLDPMNASTNDWEISSTTDKTVLYFDGNLTREQARFSYYKQTVNVKYHDTRSKRIK